jgi:hypothetical protein
MLANVHGVMNKMESLARVSLLEVASYSDLRRLRDG